MSQTILGLDETPLETSDMPCFIIRNLPNGSPCLCASTGMMTTLQRVSPLYQYEIHDILLKNITKKHGGHVNDDFISYNNITKNGDVEQKSKNLLRRSPVSFERNLNMLEAMCG
jgi:hypothetical protein